MDRKKASDYPQELLDSLCLYAHGDIDRREFVERAKRFAAGGVTAAALIESLRPNYALAQQVAPGDSRIRTEWVNVPSPEGNGTIRCYLVRPAGASGKLPGVLVVHENRGLTPYIEDVARRLGTANFMALAPDGLTSVGGYPAGDEDKARQMFPQVDRQKLFADFVAAARWLKERDDCTGKIGTVGFCFGGGVVNQLAVQLGSELSAAVPYYGAQANPADAGKIRAPLLLHYASLDTRINAGWPAYEAALKEHKADYTMHMYEGVNHAFHNDSTPRYDEAAAKLSWQRTIEFLNQHLR